MFRKIFSFLYFRKKSGNLKKIQYLVNYILDLEKKFINYSDKKLRQETDKFINLLSSGKKKIIDLLPESYALVRESSKRVFGIRYFDVQILGGIILHLGYVAEMKTGEGKTLTSTLPIYLNALLKKGVHVITVNNYLAQRDAKQNSILFNFLGLSVGLNLPNMSIKKKKKSYLSDITYGTSSEYVFDYLRDNMVFSYKKKVQRILNYALIDEIDSILIDEARTPLIISGSLKSNFNLYCEINKLIFFLVEDVKSNKLKGDFVIDRENHYIFLTDNGFKKIEKLLINNNLIKSNIFFYNPQNIKIIHHVICALKAHYLYKCNIHYIIRNNEIIIIDENTGRILNNRRWSDGLHQAIEAKENIEVKDENNVLSSITFQNYFSLYKKLSGMTGTALTEASEFDHIYNLDTISVPTYKKVIRKDLPDLIYLTEEEKINSILDDIVYRHNKGQPILVGTISIEKSELISNKLTEMNIKHNVLNAKYDLLEADIIAQAGIPGAITIATNMAGRGTDIVLGGNLASEINNLCYRDERYIKILKKKWEKRHNFVVERGGLHVIGSEKHESRRIDNQLRGRAGRQGDPGSSRFYVSLEDYFIKIFISSKIINYIKRFGIKYGECVEHPWVSKSIERIQQKIENKNFDIRKKLLNFDNIINFQRKIIFNKRNIILISKNSVFLNLIKEVVDLIFNFFSFKKIEFIVNFFYKIFSININYNVLDKVPFIKERIFIKLVIKYKNKINKINLNIFKILERNIMLRELDFFWREYLSVIEYLREGIYLYSYAQQDPIQKYKIESFKIFTNMLNNYKFSVVKKIINLSSNKYKLNNILNFSEEKKIYFE